MILKSLLGTGVQSMASNFNFTVVMAIYHKDDSYLLDKAIQSVFANTLLPNFFLLVVDGPIGSELECVLNKYRDNPFVQIIRIPTNVGLANALNVALRTVQTEYVVRADADDINLNNRFECLSETFELGYDLVGSDILEVTKDGKKIGLRKVPYTSEQINKFVTRRSPFNHMTVAFRTRAVIDAGGYPNIYLKEDYALWATLIANRCRVCNIPKILVHATTGIDMYRRRGGLKYAISEYHLQMHLVKVGMKSYPRAFFHGFLRASIFLAPNFFREWIYMKFLRNSL